jgi:RNA polymerase sigma-54 factor
MLKPSLQLRLGQQLTMTPQLQQAIKLLQLPIMDLQAHIREALESNVMLEAEEPDRGGEDLETAADRADENATAESAADVDTGWEETQLTAADSNWSSGGGEGRDSREFVDRSGTSLNDHLLWQLQLESPGPRVFVIGQALLDVINEDGYLTEGLDSVQSTLEPEICASIEEIETVLMLIQRFDPPGVGARTIGESLSLQIRQLDPATPGRELAETLALDHLEDVAQQQFSSLRRKLGCSDEELQEALLLVRACHPRPGASVNTTPPDYVVPDVYVRKIDNRWIVEINGEAAPRLRVNDTYAGLLGRGSGNTTLKAQLQEARWLVRSLEIRNDTMLKVARSIVERQHEFLERGEEAMKPMVLRDVAEAIEMHESTISRVTNGKYMHTPRGVFEFKYFFSTNLGGEDGSEHSSTEIRARIKRMIGRENPIKPLSDSRIAQALSGDGIKVARRTVAKYREAMAIPSSSERKRLAVR